MYNENIDFKALGTKLREIRISKSLTQEYVATIANVNVSHISNIENNRVKISLQTLVFVCNALDVTIDFVLSKEYFHSTSVLDNEILKELQYQNRKKNILVSLILVFFFGPLGLFYTNSIKALCMLLLLLVTIPLSIFRIYSNLIEFRITDELILWCVFFCMYWLTLWAMSVVEVNNYNAILQSRLGCKRI